MNKIFLLGRMTKDVEIKTKGKGENKKKYGRFTLAVTRSRDKEETDFINCVVFDKSAEILEKYCGKGKRVVVEGTLQINMVEDDEGYRTFTSVVVDKVEIIDFKNEEDDDEEDEPKKKKSKGKKNVSKKSKKYEDDEDDEDDEDLQF